MIEKMLIDEKSIAYTVKGDGFPLVLLHGYLETHEVWSEYADHLSEYFKVICIDIPGHGASDAFHEVHDMNTLAKKINQLLMRINAEQCVLVGHSMGGYVALAYAALFASTLKGLVLFHSSVYADTEEKKTNRLREIDLINQGKKDLIFTTNLPKMFANDNVASHDPVIAAIQRMAKSHNEDGICAILRGMMERPDQQSLIKHFEKPLLFIFGKKDNYIPTEVGEAMIRLNPKIQGAWLKNAGHMGFIEELDESVELMKRFVSKSAMTS